MLLCKSLSIFRMTFRVRPSSSDRRLCQLTSCRCPEYIKYYSLYLAYRIDIDIKLVYWQFVTWHIWYNLLQEQQSNTRSTSIQIEMKRLKLRATLSETFFWSFEQINDANECLKSIL